MNVERSIHERCCIQSSPKPFVVGETLTPFLKIEASSMAMTTALTVALAALKHEVVAGVWAEQQKIPLSV